MANLVKKFFEFIDLFYVPISFRYKKEDSYSTCIGGIFSFILIILITAFGIYYFIPFVNRENYSLYYYTINLNQTEEIDLRKSKAALAFGFECSNKANAELYKEISIEDLLELKAKYVFYKNKGKDKKNLAINIHNCNISDFYDDENLIKSISKNRMNELKCLDNLDQIIKNRYQDKHDNFMEATANNKEISRFLFKKGQVALTKDSETRYDIGLATYIADDFEDVVLGYHCALITPDESKVVGCYLNAFLHSNMSRKYFANSASGSGQRYTLSIQTIEEMPILLPEIEEQKQIGKLFSNIDRKIEINRSLNHNLRARREQRKNLFSLPSRSRKWRRQSQFRSDT